MVASFAAALAIFIAKRSGVSIPDHLALLVSVAFTTLTWVVVTYLTPPVERDVLVNFCRLVRPAGPGWRHVREAAGVGPSPDNIPQALLAWVLGCVFVYAALFGTGNYLYGRVATGIVFTVSFVLSGVWLIKLLAAIWRGGTQEVPAAELGVARVS